MHWEYGQSHLFFFALGLLPFSWCLMNINALFNPYRSRSHVAWCGGAPGGTPRGEPGWPLCRNCGEKQVIDCLYWCSLPPVWETTGIWPVRMNSATGPQLPWAPPPFPPRRCWTWPWRGEGCPFCTPTWTVCGESLDFQTHSCTQRFS